MNKCAIHILLISLLMAVLLPACEGLDENYSTNPNHRLSFSTDTLTFDTVFTTIGSTTRQFMVYNRNQEALRIESILLAEAGTSGFRINVDGRKGDSFNDVTILAEDSMYVFVEVTVNPNGENQPLLVQDSILFYVNGIRKSVLLEAFGQDVNLYKGGVTLTENTTFSAEKPYLVYDSLVVAPDVKLTIEKGATFYMHDKADFIVYGSVDAIGTLDEPITFRGDRLDLIITDLPYDRTPAQWGGIFFKEESYENSFDHVIIRNGSTGINLVSYDPNRLKLHISNSQVTNMDGNAFMAINSFIKADNTEFSNATGVLVALMVGNYQFTHCTLANFMALKSRGKNTPSLLVTNYLTEEEVGNTFLRFDNCLIDGSRKAEEGNPLSGEFLLAADDKGTFDYLFNHCVIKVDGTPNENYPECILIDESPAYRKTGGKDDKYMYDFRFASEEMAGVGKADPDISQLYPQDRYGIERLKNPFGPTIGAYEYEPYEEEKK